MNKYKTTIGSDNFIVEARDNQEARYKGAKLFRSKYQLTRPLSDITPYVSTKLVFEPYETTEEVIRSIKLIPINDYLPPVDKVNSCPLCGNYAEKLEWHHWEEEAKLRQTRVCHDCNIQLRGFFNDNYPSWSSQVERIRQYFEETNEKDSLIGESSYPSYSRGSLPPTIKYYCYSKRLRNYTVVIGSNSYRVTAYNNRKAKYEAVKLYRKDLGLTGAISTYLPRCRVEVL